MWINLGPLLYHYSDVAGEISIEPTYEMVRDIVQQVGFVLEVPSLPSLPSFLSISLLESFFGSATFSYCHQLVASLLIKCH